MLPDDRPLNKLTAQEYFEDYLEWIHNIPVEEFPDVDTSVRSYLGELEGQEGFVDLKTWGELFDLVADYIMEDLNTALNSYREKVRDEVIRGLRVGESLVETQEYVEGLDKEIEHLGRDL